jgi:hypothetical protein
LSLGVNGLVIGYGGKFIVGIGALGLVVGPYASINISAGITRGSDLQTATVGYTCRSSVVEMFMDYGVGMALPSWSVTAVNTFLNIFHAKPISPDYCHSLGRCPLQSHMIRRRPAVRINPLLSTRWSIDVGTRVSRCYFSCV